MPSRHAERFNHDEDAADYDDDVRREEDPIRAGYARVLRWVANRVPAREGPLLELGVGTGNLAALLDPQRPFVGVDVSGEMLARARQKLAGRAVPAELVQADLLETLDGEGRAYAAVVSTYAVHHLEQDEKELLLRRIGARLLPGGRALFGDLMFASPAARAVWSARCEQAGRAGLVAACEEEFFWHVDHARELLTDLGFAVEVEQLSELSWCIAATLPEGRPPPSMGAD